LPTKAELRSFVGDAAAGAGVGGKQDEQIVEGHDGKLLWMK
jgi:hypothetical protein